MIDKTTLPECSSINEAQDTNRSLSDAGVTQMPCLDLVQAKEALRCVGQIQSMSSYESNPTTVFDQVIRLYVDPPTHTHTHYIS